MAALRLRSPSVLPGFGLTLGFSIAYLSLIVLIPLAGVVWRSAELGWARVLVSCAGTDAGFPPAGLTPARFTPERGVGSEAVEGGRGLWSGGRPPVTVIAPSIDQGSGEGSTSRAARVVPIPREPLRVSRWALW